MDEQRCIDRLTFSWDAVKNVLLKRLSGSFTGDYGSLVTVAADAAFVGSEIPIRSEPGQGLRRSGRNAIRAAGFEGFVLGVGFAAYPIVVGALTHSLPTTLDIMNIILVCTAVAGPYYGLDKGGAYLMRHLAVRYVLWRRGVLPLRLIRFLEHGVALGILRRVGGGYIFTHQLVAARLAQGALNASSH